jgi:Resolvase, N terminal domain/Tn3 transposase DDE domain
VADGTGQNFRDALVVWKFDRLSRSLKDLLHIMERVREADGSSPTVARTSCTSGFANWAGWCGPSSWLQYVSDLELRQLIQAATNKSEAFNKFVQWVCSVARG